MVSAALAVDGLQVATAATGDRIVHSVSFALAPGEAMTLLGESGSGKSLLAQAILGVLPANLRAGGTVVLQGESVAADRPAQRRHWWGRRLALLPQEPWFALDPTMRAGSQLAETHRWVRGLPGRQARQAADDDLRALGLDGAAPKYPHQLSGGMAQRAAFAIARAGGAPVLIVDEPTKGLDADRKGELVATLQRLLADGGSVLAISHDTDIARALGGQAAVMLDGRLVEHGRAADLLDRPQHAYTRTLLQAAPHAWPTMAGTAPPADAPPVLTARRLAKRFGDHAFLFEDLDVDVARGERIAISGPSGSGKSTLGNVLLGLVRADRGNVERAAGSGSLAFQKLYQDPTASFAPRRTLRQALADLASRHRLDPAALAALMARLRLGAPLLDRLPRQLSGGEMQRFAMVRVLALRPAFVFADEPTSRLDPITQRETFQLLMDSVGDTGSAIAVVTHDAQIAAKVATRTIRLGGPAAAQNVYVTPTFRYRPTAPSWCSDGS